MGTDERRLPADQIGPRSTAQEFPPDRWLTLSFFIATLMTAWV